MIRRAFWLGYVSGIATVGLVLLALVAWLFLTPDPAQR